MEHLEAHDLIRLKEILRRTGEFIAYFELAETKMIEWRQSLEHQSLSQQQQFHQQLNSMHNELGYLKEIVTEAGLARFRITADAALNQGKSYLLAMQKIEQQLTKQIASHQHELTHLIEMAVDKISHHATDSINRIDAQLSQFDAQHFYRIANESCEQVEKSATNAIIKSGKLLRLFQWRSVAVALLTTLLSAFAIGLYISDEYPWEVHQRAMNERETGKMLMNAWANLSYQEKTKILGYQANPKG